MTKEEIEKIEKRLEAKGYKKITQCKAQEHDDYEWYKAFYDIVKDSDGDDEKVPKYQIFFQFWDFTKYDAPFGWSISISIMPDSCIDNVGRRDLELSVDWASDIEKVEQVAESFYSFIRKMDTFSMN